MCGRFLLVHETDELKGFFAIDGLEDLQPRFNIGPTQPVLGIVGAPGGERKGYELKWGLVPRWATDHAMTTQLINARVETVHEKPSFRASFRDRRCLIPASGYYEWKRSGSGKQTYHIRSVEGRLLTFAGLWERWQGEDGLVVESCTIITKPAHPDIEAIHGRMPLMVDPAHFDLWLDSTRTTPDGLTTILRGRDEQPLEAIAVSDHVNRIQNDGPRCIAPVEVQQTLF